MCRKLCLHVKIIGKLLIYTETNYNIREIIITHKVGPVRNSLFHDLVALSRDNSKLEKQKKQKKVMLYAAGMIGVRWMQVLWRKTAVWCLVFSCDDRVVVALLRLKERLAMAVLKLPEGGNHALGISLMYQVPL